MPRSCAATLEAAYVRLEQAFEAMRGSAIQLAAREKKKVHQVLYLGRSRANWRRSDWLRRGYIMHVHDANRKRPRNKKKEDMRHAMTPEAGEDGKPNTTNKEKKPGRGGPASDFFFRDRIACWRGRNASEASDKVNAK